MEPRCVSHGMSSYYLRVAWLPSYSEITSWLQSRMNSDSIEIYYSAAGCSMLLFKDDAKLAVQGSCKSYGSIDKKKQFLASTPGQIPGVGEPPGIPCITIFPGLKLSLAILSGYVGWHDSSEVVRFAFDLSSLSLIADPTINRHLGASQAGSLMHQLVQHPSEGTSGRMAHR